MVGRGGRPKQHANVDPAHADVELIDGDEHAQRDKRRERLPVFALERAERPAPQSKTHHHKAGNPTDEITGCVHLRSEQQLGKQRRRNEQLAPVITSRPAAAAAAHIA